MPENIPIQPEVPEESKFEKYAPIVKSLAAIGVGLAGNSGMSRGIATGLAASAKEDVRIKQILDDERRKQTERDIKARQDQLKLQFDTMYKVWNSLDSEKAKSLYAEQTNFWNIAEKYVGTDITVPPSPEAPEGLDVNLGAIRNDINVVEDPGHKAHLEVLFGSLQKFVTEGDATAASIASERIYKSLNPTPKTYFKADGSGARNFTDGKTAFDHGYPLTSYPTSTKDVDTNDKYDLKIRTKNIDSDSDKLKSSSSIVYDNETVNYVKGFQNLSADIESALLLANNIENGTPPRLNESPLPGVVNGPFEILAAGQLLTRIVNGAEGYPGAIEKLGTMAGIEDVIKDNIGEVLQISENRMATFQGREPIQFENDKDPGFRPDVSAPPSSVGSDDELFIQLKLETGEAKTREEAIEMLKGL